MGSRINLRQSMQKLQIRRQVKKNIANKSKNLLMIYKVSLSESQISYIKFLTLLVLACLNLMCVESKFQTSALH